MTEFVGRTGARRVYSYPETPRGAGALAFARNFAFGPAGETPTPIDAVDGTQVPWGTIDVPASPPTLQDVPITPRVTGIIRVEAVLTIINSTGSPVSVRVGIQVNAASVADPFYPIPGAEVVTIPGVSAVAIPILTEINPALPLGTQATIQVRAVATSAPALSFVQQSCTLDVQEVLAATG